MTMTARRIAVISAGLSNPSSTRMLADRLAKATADKLTEAGVEVAADTFELRDYAHDITNNLLTGFAPAELEKMLGTVVSADAIIAVTPIFSTSYSGLFKSFIDVLDPDALRGKPLRGMALVAAGLLQSPCSLDRKHACWYDVSKRLLSACGGLWVLKSAGG